MHDSLSDLRPGARLYPEVVDLVRREVVQVHLEGRRNDMAESIRRVTLTLALPGRESRGGCSLWPCALHGWLDMVMPLERTRNRRRGEAGTGQAARVFTRQEFLFCRVILLQELATERRAGVYNQVPGRCVVALPLLSPSYPLTPSLVLPDSTDCTNTQGLRRNEKRILSVL